MTKQWIIVVAVAAATVALVVFLIIRNIKDEKLVVKQLEADYPKQGDHLWEADHID